jgi:hypothetical protein
MMAAYGVAPTWAMLALPSRSTIVSAARRRHPVRGAHRHLPRRALRHRVRDADLAVRHARALHPRHHPGQWHTLYALNPMVGMIAGSARAYPRPWPSGVILVSAVSALLMFAAGIRYFSRWSAGSRVI